MTRNQYQAFGTVLGTLMGLVFILISRTILPQDIFHPYYWVCRVCIVIALMGCHVSILLRVMNKYGVKD